METTKQKCFEVFGIKLKTKAIKGLIQVLHNQKLLRLKMEQRELELRCIWL